MVVIKGMDFPKKCAECQFRVFDYDEAFEEQCFITSHIIENLDSKDTDCPLIEVKEREEK